MAMGGPLFVTERSAATATVVVDVPELFAAVGSVVLLDAVAVFVITVAAGTLESTLTTSVKTSFAPLATLAFVHVNVPPAPTVNALQL